MQIIAPAMLSAVKFFNWTRIAILTQEEGLFTGVIILMMKTHVIVKSVYS